MENRIHRTAVFFAALLALAGIFSFSFPAFAEDQGVGGCSAVAVDPNATLEEQQAVCGNAEQFGASSCAAGGHGVCSSPKTNDIMPGANHCICVEPTEEVAVV